MELPPAESEASSRQLSLALLSAAAARAGGSREPAARFAREMYRQATWKQMTTKGANWGELDPYRYGVIHIADTNYHYDMMRN